MPANQFDDKKANLKTLISSIGAKEVDCRVRLTIHSVSNIPVLSGGYRVRWKFRDTDTKAGKQNHKKEQDRLTTLSVPTITASDVDSVSSRNSISTITGLSDSSGLLQPSQPPESGVSVTPAAVNASGEERGNTPYRNLRARDHTVTFDHAIDVVARMRIVKGELIGEPLKLVVERRTDETEAIGTVKYEPRLGHKYVDLAEFVNEGKVRRKFLLDRSKTNAMVLISLDITTVKTGIDFKKPPLRQDHLLIGRKEPVRSTRDKNAALINNAMGDALKPGLSRTSSTTSKSSSIRSFGSKGMVPSRSETEAVIEALFNPTIFTRSAPPPLPSPIATKIEEAMTPRPQSPRRHRSTKSYSSSGSSSTPSSPLSSQPIAEHAELVLGRSHKPHSLHDRSKSPLTIVLDMNADKDRTIRPKFFNDGSGNPDNYEFVDHADGSRSLKKKSTADMRGPHRTTTGDSLASSRTDFSTTSSYPSRQDSTSSFDPPNTSSSPNETDDSPTTQTAVTLPEDGGYIVPTIAIISETPTTATQSTFPQQPQPKSSRWFKPFRKSEGGSRPGTPNPAESKRSFDVELTGH